MRNQTPIEGLLEKYILSCVGCLSAEEEELMNQRLQRTYRKAGDWRTILREVLHLDEDVEHLMRRKWETYQKRSSQGNPPPGAIEFARFAMEDECFAKLMERSIPSGKPPAPWGATVTVKAVGFWRDADGDYPQYPWPQTLVRPGWCGNDLKKILSYLRSGYNAHPNFAYGGWSTCRFKNCVAGEHNGSGEATDGVWGWPDGLSHYVECHDILLPEEFIETMRTNGWRPPPLPTPPHLTQLDDSFWIDWGICNSWLALTLPRGRFWPFITSWAKSLRRKKA
jgi:hypothetical protein